MAKRRAKKNSTKQKRIDAVLIPLGILFTVVMFVVKLFGGSISWIEVFIPLLIIFFIVFVLSAIKTVLKRA